MKILKGLGAILAGFVVVAVLSLVTDIVVYTLWGVRPFSRPMTSSLFLLAMLYRAAYGILGAYLTARLAPSRPLRHAIVGGALGLLLGIVGAFATWNNPSMGPRWYAVAVAASALPCAWLGGRVAGGVDP